MGFLDRLLGREKKAAAETHDHDHDHDHNHDHAHEAPAPGTAMPEAGTPGEEPGAGGQVTPP